MPWNGIKSNKRRFFLCAWCFVLFFSFFSRCFLVENIRLGAFDSCMHTIIYIGRSSEQATIEWVSVSSHWVLLHLVFWSTPHSHIRTNPNFVGHKFFVIVCFALVLEQREKKTKKKSNALARDAEIYNDTIMSYCSATKCIIFGCNQRSVCVCLSCLRT